MGWDEVRVDYMECPSRRVTQELCAFTVLSKSEAIFEGSK
jgi:hypothetical protein